jgi:quercetin dioxygenase-like cupin family protein
VKNPEIDLADEIPGAQREPEPIGSPLLKFALRNEIHRLQAEPHPWQAGRNAKILVKYPNLRVILIGLQPGSHLSDHHAAGPVSIQIISGHVLVRAAGRVFNLQEGELLALETGVPHDLEALAESAILVTISWLAGGGA